MRMIVHKLPRTNRLPVHNGSMYSTQKLLLVGIRSAFGGQRQIQSIAEHESVKRDAHSLFVHAVSSATPQGELDRRCAGASSVDICSCDLVAGMVCEEALFPPAAGCAPRSCTVCAEMDNEMDHAEPAALLVRNEHVHDDVPWLAPMCCARSGLLARHSSATPASREDTWTGETSSASSSGCWSRVVRQSNLVYERITGNAANV
mmetsp:Transcript_25769/g.56488  ORF Transcript_25769/g.56488 Transcript_25769/m.56488 type:complete len:204 (-) Transcript_25769:7-618(-)